jgi:hypothetical protein
MTYKKQNLETEENANYQKRLKEYEVHKIQNTRETLFRAQNSIIRGSLLRERSRE